VPIAITEIFFIFCTLRSSDDGRAQRESAKAQAAMSDGRYEYNGLKGVVADEGIEMDRDGGG
jgi:hypothetical protein